MLFITVHQAAAQGVNFAPAFLLDIGFAPAYVVAADVNGDGKPDLISANIGGGTGGTGTLTVMTNDGSGGFALEATLDVGNFPLCVVAADVNGDGKLDLISADFGPGGSGNTLTIWTNNGNGFGYNSTLTVGLGPVSVVAADVNGDGKVDLICANDMDGTLTVLTNNGNGGFGLYATLPVGASASSYPDSVAVADVNGDGKPDLISANSNNGTLTVLTNNGNGGFGLNATLTVGSGPASVIAADVNGNGKPDLISANAYDGTLTVLTNNGHGLFGFNATLNVGLSTNSSPENVVAVDVNGDGKLDLVSADFGDDTLTVLINDGSGGFGTSATLSVGDAGSEPNSVAAADVNGDGRLDLISANFGNNTLSVLVNETTGAPVAPSLAISLTESSTVVVSWPSPSDGYVLQQNSDLATTNWLDFSGTVNDNGTTKSASITPLTDSQFFRLRHP